MGKPCGCAGSCGCDIRGRNGVRVSGSGIAPDTMWIELDGSSPNACNTIMDCVGANLGQGLLYNAGTRKVSVRLAAGTNQITFGPDGGLLVTGAGGGGSAAGQTVANLPAGTNTIIGSSWGAGSAMWPEGVRASIDAAANYAGTAVRMVHIPLRVSSDFFPICLAESNMSWYLRDSVTQTPRNMDHREHAQALIKPSDSPPTAENGYFGYYQPTGQGSPTLADAFRALGRRVVVVAEVRDTVSPGDSADRVKELAPQFDVTQSIIVAGEPTPSTGLNGPTILEAISASMTGSGMPIGVVFRTRQQVIDYPPSRLATLGVTWVFVDKDLVDTAVANHVSTEVTAYRTAGLNVMLHGVHRQYHAARAAALQLRGSLCTDPIYAYGASSQWRYRKDSPSWNWPAPQVGQHSSWSNTLVGQSAHYRGIILDGTPGVSYIPADLYNPEQVEPYPSGYWLLPGEINPLRNASTYAVQCWWRWNNSLPADRVRWAGLWLDAPTDRSLRDWSGATAQTVGYLFSMSVGQNNAYFVLTEYDGTPGQPPAARQLGVWDVPYTVSPNIFYGMRAEMTPTALRLYAGTLSWPNPFQKVLIATIPNPHRYIGGVNNGYVYYGRHFFNQQDAKQLSIAGLSVSYTGF